MRAVILAAGRGGRLCGVVGSRPKCLARIGDTAIIERQIRTLTELGLAPITVVAGYGESDVRRVCPADVEIVSNTRHAATNSLYSLWLVRHALADGFVVLNCDVLFHPRMLADLMDARYANALLTCSRGTGDAYSPEEMKVHIARGLVRAIDKTLPDAESDAENVGVGKFGPSGARALVDTLNRVVSEGDVRAWLPRAFDLFCRDHALHAVDTRGLPWIEIDYPEDYWRACAEILPAIEETSSPCMSASTTSASGRFRSARIPSTSIQAGSTKRP